MPRRPLTLSLHEDHPRHTLRADTGIVMRKTFLLLALLALSLPVAGVASLSAGDGTLSVEDGKGKVTIQARGGVIGRLDRGTVTHLRPYARGYERSRSLRRRPACRAGRRERDQVHRGRHALPRHRWSLPHPDPGPRDRPLASSARASARSRATPASPACTRSTVPTAGKTGLPASCCPRSRSASCSRPHAEKNAVRPAADG